MVHRGPDDDGHARRRPRRRRARRAPPEHHRRRGRPPAGLQRGRHDLGGAQRGDLQPPGAAGASARARPHARQRHGHRGARPPLRGVRRRAGPRARGDVRVHRLGQRAAPADRRPRPLRREAALLHPRGRTARARLRAHALLAGAAVDGRARARARRRVLRVRLRAGPGVDRARRAPAAARPSAHLGRRRPTTLDAARVLGAAGARRAGRSTARPISRPRSQRLLETSVREPADRRRPGRRVPQRRPGLDARDRARRARVVAARSDVHRRLRRRHA